MAGITFEAGALITKLKAASQGKIRTQVEAVLQREGALAQRRMSERVTKGGKSGLNVRTGMLRASLGFETETKPGSVVLTLGTTKIGGETAKVLAYAAAQEFGATITKSPGFLTIPLDRAKTPSGVARFSARDTMSKGRVPGLTSTFFIGDFKRKVLMGVFGGEPSKSFSKSAVARAVANRGVGVNTKMAHTTGKALKTRGKHAAILGKGNAVPLFLLVHKVVIPARPYVSPEKKIAFANIRAELPNVLARAMK